VSGTFMNFSDALIRGMHVLFTKICAWFVDNSQLSPCNLERQQCTGAAAQRLTFCLAAAFISMLSCRRQARQALQQQLARNRSLLNNRSVVVRLPDGGANLRLKVADLERRLQAAEAGG